MSFLAGVSVGIWMAVPRRVYMKDINNDSKQDIIVETKGKDFPFVYKMKDGKEIYLDSYRFRIEERRSKIEKRSRIEKILKE